MSDDLLNHREVADMLGINPQTVHAHVKSGVIPKEAYFRLDSGARGSRGNMIRFHKDHIETLAKTLAKPEPKPKTPKLSGMDGLISAKEAGPIMGVDPRTVRLHVQMGAIPDAVVMREPGEKQKGKRGKAIHLIKSRVEKLRNEPDKSRRYNPNTGRHDWTGEDN